MAIFGREEVPSNPVAGAIPTSRTKPTPTPKVTTVGAGTRILGELSGTTEVRMEGRLEGNVRLDAVLIVGSGGVVEGDIDAVSVKIAGEVRGNVTASDGIEVLERGVLRGNLEAPKVAIASGAFVQGRVSMSSPTKGDA